MAEFKGLTSEHFATYEPSRWSSMVHNLARMKAKDEMVEANEAESFLFDDELAALLTPSPSPVSKPGRVIKVGSVEGSSAARSCRRHRSSDLWSSDTF